jgi:hypothetical protein
MKRYDPWYLIINIISILDVCYRDGDQKKLET